MKYCLTAIFMLFTAVVSAQSSLQDTTLLTPVEVEAIRANDKTPVAKTNLSRAVIEKNNVGQDLPFIIKSTPSVVVSSDAGNGFGYTGIRIRGTDAGRINVTLNGIPYNDAESQGTFFVDLPDLVSSAGSIQIQRGVGTSSNGSGAFGGAINISTNEIKPKQYFEFNNTAGSYGSLKSSLLFNSGLFNKHFLIDARVSHIRSEGYVDRATSRLYAFQASAAYIDEVNSLRFNVILGKQKTYLAWNGVDESTLATNRRFNPSGTEKEDGPYENETDNYIQNHYQLFYNRKLSSLWKANAAVFLTTGEGYYEQYKAGESFSDYGLPDFNTGSEIITETDLVRQLWLDNKYYGSVFSVHHDHTKRNLILGGSITNYDGLHFGKIIYAAAGGSIPPDYKWYDLPANKSDYSVYSKWSEKLGSNWQTFLDVQLRRVNYDIHGFRDNPSVVTENKYTFLNPKAGITFSKNNLQLFLSYGVASKEPNRDDFEAGLNNSPKHETLFDIEMGFQSRFKRARAGINIYYMKYRDQLVLTGKINDVGAYTRTNIDKSYRAGMEAEAEIELHKKLKLSGNFTVSTNKLKDFTEYLDDYDNGGQVSNFYKSTTISFSPSFIGNWNLTYLPIKNVQADLTGQFVSRQYLDNTSNKSRSLKPFYVQDIRVAYTLNSRQLKYATFFIKVNNVFSSLYEPNGYSFSYLYNQQQVTENFYFPMATVNFLAGINLRF